MAAEPSNKNPEKNMSFKLNPTIAVQFKQSTAVLCDSEFNPKGVGMLEITEKGFGITVHNAETRADGKLFLKSSSGIIDFHCNNPIAGKMINLTQILETSTDDDSITVYHVDGSTHLSFIFGRAPNEEVKVELLEKDAEFEKLPDMEICCETVLKSEIIREMIDHLTKIPKLFVVDISEKKVGLRSGRRDHWCLVIEDDDENFETRVFTEADKGYHASFKLEHYEAMKKASAVAPRFHLRCSTENIMMRFKLQEVGDLVFFHRSMLSPDP